MYRKYLGRRPKRRRVSVTSAARTPQSHHHKLSSNGSSALSSIVTPRQGTASLYDDVCQTSREGVMCDDQSAFSHKDASLNPLLDNDIIIPDITISTNARPALSPTSLQRFDSFPSLSTLVEQSQQYDSSVLPEGNHTTPCNIHSNATNETSLLFSRKRDKTNRSAYNRKRRLIQKLKNCIQSLGTLEEQAVIIEETLKLPALQEVKSMARLVNSTEHSIMSKVTNNVFKSLKQVSDKSSCRGRINQDKKVNQESLVLALYLHHHQCFNHVITHFKIYKSISNAIFRFYQNDCSSSVT